MSTLQGSLRATLSLYRPELEILWVLLTYAPYIPPSMAYTSRKLSRARNYPYIPLLVHILIAPMLVLRYHARYAATRTWPPPDVPDLVLFTVFNLTSFILEASRSSQHYNGPAGRTGFQAVILIQTVAFSTSWLQGRDPTLFRASIKIMNWFASFRILLQWAEKISPGLKKDYPLKWSSTVVLSANFAMWEAGVPGGVPVFLGLTALFMVLERTVAEVIHG